jgi:hypothetical protein
VRAIYAPFEFIVFAIDFVIGGVAGGFLVGVALQTRQRTFQCRK